MKNWARASSGGSRELQSITPIPNAATSELTLAPSAVRALEGLERDVELAARQAFDLEHAAEPSGGQARLGGGRISCDLDRVRMFEVRVDDAGRRDVEDRVREWRTAAMNWTFC